MRRTSILLLSSLLLLPACAGANRSSGAYRSTAATAPPPPSYPNYGAPAAVPGSAPNAEIAATGKAYAAEADYVASSDESVGTGSGSASPPGPAAAPSAVEPQQSTEMFDIEARISIEVEKVGDAAGRVRDIARKHFGQIVADTVNDDVGSSAASFTLRVPSKGSDAFLTDLSGIGVVRNRQVTARDIGKEFHDAQIHQKNLEVTLKRYEEILAKAQDVNQILSIEREMTRIRGEIDRVKGDLRWMKDRVTRATIYITIYTSRPDSTPAFDPKAKLYPGVRALHFADFRGSKGDFGFMGFGLSVAASRYFSVDIDGMRRLGNPGQGLDAFFVTLGGEFYSDFLGAGRRNYLNPYIGLRIGYARIAANEGAKDEMLVGGTVGVELYKTKFFRFDAQTRLLGLFGNKDVGGHFGVQSGLQMHFAF